MNKTQSKCSYDYDKWYESQPDKYCKDCGKGPLKFKHRCDDCKLARRRKHDRDSSKQKLRNIPKLCKRCDTELKERVRGQQHCSDCAKLNCRDATRKHREKNPVKRYCRDCGVSELELNKKVCDDCREQLYRTRLFNLLSQRYCKDCGDEIGKFKYRCDECKVEWIRKSDRRRYGDKKGLFTRKCPICDDILEYCNKSTYDNAKKDNSSCRSCEGTLSQLNKFGFNSLEEKEKFIRKNGDYRTYSNTVRNMTKRKLKEQLPDLWEEYQKNPWSPLARSMELYETGLTIDHLRPVSECWREGVSMEEASNVIDIDGKLMVEIVTMKENGRRWVEYMRTKLPGKLNEDTTS
tara:strand:+ start:62 stop:1108 length:1047 start_codon:yes stop_codon:yes gene_type:complete